MRRGALALLAVVGVGATSAVAASSARPTSGSRAKGVPLVRIHFEFRIEERATHYTVVNTGDSAGSMNLDLASYDWKLEPPENDMECNNHGTLRGQGKEFVWRHGNEGDPISNDHCNHAGNTVGPSGHPGTVSVLLDDGKWTCSAEYTGTQRADGNASGDAPDGDCTPVDCDQLRARAAEKRGTVLGLQIALAAVTTEYKQVRAMQDPLVEKYNAADTAWSKGAGNAKEMLDAKYAFEGSRDIMLKVSSKLVQLREQLAKAHEELAQAEEGGGALRGVGAPCGKLRRSSVAVQQRGGCSRPRPGRAQDSPERSSHAREGACGAGGQASLPRDPAPRARRGDPRGDSVGRAVAESHRHAAHGHPPSGNGRRPPLDGHRAPQGGQGDGRAENGGGCEESTRRVQEVAASCSDTRVAERRT
jgi:hypothetical protein